jgi:phenylalanyl-tRNA synthetase beta chain
VLRLFEVGRVFQRNPEAQVGELSIAGYDQPVRVAGLAYGPAVPEQWGTPTRSVDFFDVKGDLEALLAPLEFKAEKTEHPALHPGRSAQISIKKRGKDIHLGVIGELHPRWQQAYDIPGSVVLFEIDWAAIQDIGLPVINAHQQVPSGYQGLGGGCGSIGDCDSIAGCHESSQAVTGKENRLI